MNKVGTFVAFVLGAAAGSAATWYFLKTKYEKIAQEEIDSVKEKFTVPKVEKYEGPEQAEEAPHPEEAIKAAEVAKTKPSVIEYAAELARNKYTDMQTEVEKLEEQAKTPYVITPDSFGELDEYDRISLTYYGDQIIADDNDEIVEDVDAKIGFDSLNRFGEYEDDVIHVRNDILKCDYEIAKDYRRYSDVVSRFPYKDVDD